MKKTAESILLILSLVCIGLLPNVQAVSPPPDGGYLGGNTAEGQDALLSLTSGLYNTAAGLYSLRALTGGSFNTAIGAGALLLNTANENTAIGAEALFNNTTGNFNIALGQGAGSRLTTGDSNIDIGAFGFPGESATIRIGEGQTKTFIDGIRGATVVGGVPVVIDGSGQLGTIVSSKRFKKEIQPMEKASEAILALKRVTFLYKSDAT